MNVIEATSGPLPPAPELLNDPVRLIVEAVPPLRIILFGSAARGQMGPDSDLDVLVVVPGGTHVGRAVEDIYMKVGLGVPKDVVVITESDARVHADNPCLVVHWALKEGKELYRAAG